MSTRVKVIKVNGVDGLKITTVKGDTLGAPLATGLTFTATDSAGDPIDLTGYVILLEIKKMKDSPSPMMTFDSTSSDTSPNGDGIINIDEPNGEWTLFKNAEQMDVPPPFEDFYFDIQMTAPDASVFTWMSGTWTHEESVSD